MLITIYQLRYDRWLAIREYYWFPVVIPLQEVAPAPGITRPRYSCPGCAHEFTAVSLRDHICLGGTPDYPRINDKKYRANRRWRPAKNIAATEPTIEDLALEDYIKTAKHPVVVSDDE